MIAATTADPSFFEQIGPTLFAIVATGIVTAVVGLVGNRMGRQSARSLAEEARRAELVTWYRTERLRTSAELITRSLDQWGVLLDFAQAVVQMHEDPTTGDLEAPQDLGSAALRPNIDPEVLKEAHDSMSRTSARVADTLHHLQILGPDALVAPAETLYFEQMATAEHIVRGYLPDSDIDSATAARHAFTAAARAVLREE